MLNKLSISIIGSMCIFIANAGNAHSPELHKKKNAEKPKCEAMNNMDHSTMDMNDPIMQAMMKQCMGSDNQGSDNHSDEHQGMEQKNMEKKDSGSSHGDMHKTDDDHHGEMKKSQ